MEPCPPLTSPSWPPAVLPELTMTVSVLKAEVIVEVTPSTGTVEPAAPLPWPPSPPDRSPELRMTVCVLNADVEVKVGPGV
jgi:hypothetical protein